MLETVTGRPAPPAVIVDADATAAVRTSPPSPRPTGLLVGVFVLGLLHALVFVAILPAWAIEDEPQHVDYVLHLAHDHALPDLDGEIAPSITQSMFTQERWGGYGPGPAPQPPVADLGLAGRSYLAYHPPLPYLAMAALTPAALDGDGMLVVLRVLTALAYGLACAGTALLAARITAGIGRSPTRWTPAVRRAALGAGVTMAALPVLADAGGRVNTDGFAVLAVVVTLLALLRFHERRSMGRALLAGVALAGAAMTRETTIVLLVPLIAVVAFARHDRVLRTGHVVRLVGPALASVAAWTAVVWIRTGQPVGSQAFMSRFGAPFAGQSLGETLRDLPGQLLLPYGDWNLAAPVLALVGVGLVVGIVAAARSGLGWAAMIATAMFAVALVVFALGATSGLTTITARLLLPAFPAMVAVSASGWSRRYRSTGTLVWLAVTVAFGAWFVLGDLVPRYAGVG